MSRETQESSIKAHPGLSVSNKLEHVHRAERLTLNYPPILRVAHRGASAQYPENTMLAFRRAIEQGVDALELDVHLTADDELVIIHDSTLERTTNGYGNVRDHSSAGNSSAGCRSG